MRSLFSGLSGKNGSFFHRRRPERAAITASPDGSFATTSSRTLRDESSLLSQTETHVETLSHRSRASVSPHRRKDVPANVPEDAFLRLIKITSMEPKETVKLRCELHTFNFRDAPDYVALSYTWGSPLKHKSLEHYSSSESDVAIMLTGDGRTGVEYISLNLYEALERVFFFDGAQPYIWADSISINQFDAEEKSHQVQQMGTIFFLADKVYSWLGKPDPKHHYEDILSIVNSWTPVVLSKQLHTTSKLVFEYESREVVRVVGTSLRLTATQLDSFNEFCSDRRYFSRAWVFQEMVSHERPVTLLLGNLSINLPDLTRILRLLDREIPKENNVFAYDHDFRSWPSFKLRDLSQMLQMKSIYGAPELSKRVRHRLEEDFLHTGPAGRFYSLFTELAHSTSELEATNPRDLIYSRLQFAKKGLPSSLSCPIVVDYDKSVEDTFYAISVSILEHVTVANYLNKLPAPENRKLTDLPSWVWDFSADSFSSLFRRTEIRGFATRASNRKRRERKYQEENRHEPVCATCESASCHKLLRGEGARASKRSFSIKGPELKIRGSQVDTVRIAAPWSQYDENAGTMREFVNTRIMRLHFPLEVLAVCNAQTQDEEDRIMAGLAHVICDGTDVNNPGMGETSQDLREGIIHTLEIGHRTSLWLAATSRWPEVLQLFTACLRQLDLVDGRYGIPRRADLGIPDNDYADVKAGSSNDGSKAKAERVSESEAYALWRITRLPVFMQLACPKASMFLTKRGLFGQAVGMIQREDEVWLLDCVYEAPALLRRQRSSSSPIIVATPTSAAVAAATSAAATAAAATAADKSSTGKAQKAANRSNKTDGTSSGGPHRFLSTAYILYGWQGGYFKKRQTRDAEDVIIV